MVKTRSDSREGIVFDIQRYSIHDGPGIRTVVFLKGCPLNCMWCQNPEGINPKPEIGFNSKKCTGCGRCIEVCPVGCIDYNFSGRVNRSLCTICGKCVNECYAEALTILGRLMTPEDVLKEVQKDVYFYKKNGGVTFSGGEPTFQDTFLKDSLKLCKEKGFNTALETCGLFKWSDFKHLLQNIDTVLFDLKIIDEKKHIKYCGNSNELILQNAEKIASVFPNIQFRIPLIPRINDDKKNIRQTCEFIKKLNQKSLSIIPYHKLGYEKYSLLNKSPRDYGVKPITLKKIENVQKWIKESGLTPILVI